MCKVGNPKLELNDVFYHQDYIIAQIGAETRGVCLMTSCSVVETILFCSRVTSEADDVKPKAH